MQQFGNGFKFTYYYRMVFIVHFPKQISSYENLYVFFYFVTATLTWNEEKVFLIHTKNNLFFQHNYENMYIY